MGRAKGGPRGGDDVRRAIQVLKLVASVLCVPVAILLIQPGASAEASDAQRISGEAWLASGSCLAFAGYLVATRRRGSDLS